MIWSSIWRWITLRDVSRVIKAAATKGQEASVVTDYTLKIHSCKYGGQKNRVTTFEMIVGPALKEFFLMDEISTVKSLKEFLHILQGSAVISLLKPAPETYDLFDHIILMIYGKIVYQGPREHVLNFFESMGFRCPERKGVADFLQKRTIMSCIAMTVFLGTEMHKRDLQDGGFGDLANRLRFWGFLANSNRFYGPIWCAVLYLLQNQGWNPSFARVFLFTWLAMLEFEPDVKTDYWKTLVLFCLFEKENLGTEMHKRDLQDGGFYAGALFFGVVMIMFNGMSEISMTIANLPVFFKQRDFLFYPSWAYAIPSWIIKIPVLFLEATITYYAIGLDLNVS
ncbi:pleiotropic drug resistance protein 1-like protein, partial [Tanacetum coccineum]